jgi:hypothetical protein
MGTLLFGHDETISCIQHVEVKGPNDESLCLAYKTTKTFVGAGVYLRDDGYVLGLEKPGGDKVTSFVRFEPGELERLQSSALLPRPLPAYQIPWFEYAFGYSLWIVLAGTAIWYAVKAKLKSAGIQRRAAQAAATPVSYGPPLIATAADRFVESQVAPLLQLGETVQYQAYTLDRDPGGSALDSAKMSARFVALTQRRLFLIDTRVAVFGIVLENRKVEVIDRARIVRLAVDDRLIVLGLDDGIVRALWIQRTNKLSNQDAFLLDVPRILAAGHAAAAS